MGSAPTETAWHATQSTGKKWRPPERTAVAGVRVPAPEPDRNALEALVKAMALTD